MATLLDEVVAYLVNEGVGTFGTDIFIGYEPATPKNTVTLFPTGGSPPSFDGKEYPTMQVRVRNETYPDGYAKAIEVYLLLNRQEDILDTWHGRCFAMQSSPMFIGYGENGEFLFTQNFRWLISVNSD